MFSESAAIYDLIYSTFKNYDAETEQLAMLLARAATKVTTSC